MLFYRFAHTGFPPPSRGIGRGVSRGSGNPL